MQAREVGQRLALDAYTVGVVVVSPFLRCIQTAHEVIIAYEDALARVWRRPRAFVDVIRGCIGVTRGYIDVTTRGDAYVTRG